MTWTPPADYTPAVITDLFPAVIQISDPTTNAITEEHPKARVIVTAAPDPRVFVFVDTTQGPDALVVAQPDLSTLFGTSSTGYQVTLSSPYPSPRTLRITPSGGCGCGSNLRSLSPFTTMRHTSVIIPETLPTPAPAPAPAPIPHA